MSSNNINTPWSQVGCLTYKRTYARAIEGTDRTEEFPETVERNTIKMRILKSRYTGLTGVVKGAFYNYDTGRLTGIEEAIDEDFVSL